MVPAGVDFVICTSPDALFDDPCAFCAEYIDGSLCDYHFNQARAEYVDPVVDGIGGAQVNISKCSACGYEFDIAEDLCNVRDEFDEGDDDFDADGKPYCADDCSGHYDYYAGCDAGNGRYLCNDCKVAEGCDAEDYGDYRLSGGVA